MDSRLTLSAQTQLGVQVLHTLLTHKRDADTGTATVRLDVQEAFSRETVLHHILKMPNRTEVSQYQDCFTLLTDTFSGTVEPELRKIINKRDTCGNSALHCATQAWPALAVRQLLERGANIGLKVSVSNMESIALSLL